MYPRKLLDSDLRRDAKLSFGLSVICASFYAREDEIAIKFKRLDSNINEVAQRYRKKVETWMKIMKDLNYL